MALKTTKDKLLDHLFQEDIDEDNKKAPPTASTRIRSQCAALVAALMECAPHYVRCIKSNDAKRPLTIDAGRVKHQVQYLGLVENIKVRRAGFAYRAEYHRFLERFGILSPLTYPEWRGSDKDGCRTILKHIAAGNLIPGLSKEEAQLGASKVFVQKPETYFALERLLEVRRGDFVARIQRAWRKHASQKEYTVLCSFMARLYRQNGKMRRRDSIFRPFTGDYLVEMDAGVVGAVREGIFRIIDYYDETENIVFADASCGLVGPKMGSGPLGGSSSSSGSGSAPTCKDWGVDRVLVVVTNKALYLCQVHPLAPTWRQSEPRPKDHSDKPHPVVTLRRRVLVAGKEKGQGSRQLCVLSGAGLSKLADETLVLKVRPHAALPQPVINHWVPDASQPACFATGEKFTFFNRRHHCRVCGHIFCDRACDTLQAVPDLGHYQPVRVCDACRGVESSDASEDLLLLSARRTELTSVLRSAWAKCPFRAKEAGQGDGGMPISFQNSTKLDNSNAGGALSRRPGEEVIVTELARGAALVPGFGVSLAINGPKLVVASAQGLPHDVAEEKQRRQVQRQKAAAERRRREDAARRERSAVREEARERERLQRLAEKKARKREEKEAKRAQEEGAAAASAAKASAGGGGRKFGSVGAAAAGAGAGVGGSTASAGGGAGSELAARMAKMRARAGGD